MFVNENFFNYETKDKFDAIICFKTTKWVHLALADEGLTALFEKIYSLLQYYCLDSVLTACFSSSTLYGPPTCAARTPTHFSGRI